MDDPNIKDFESALAELEAIVKTLEDGQLPLEQSLEHFERGIALSRFCHTRLEDAERRVELLTERGQTRPAPDEIAGRQAPAGDAPAAGGADDGQTDDDVAF
ncbi:MAG: exodeoxyribonuclease VII small subunit [Acidobacteria bacterium]|nr:exodeoxyribonuclease VII small subunit [Acidobacteriota bacterium]